MAKAKKLPSGNWRVQVYMGTDKNGKRIYQSVTAETEAKANYEAEQVRINHRNKIKEQDDFSKLTVETAMLYYIDSKTNILSPKTINEYNKMANKYYTDIKDIRLCDLTNYKIQFFVNTLAAKLSCKSIRNIYGLLAATIRMFYTELSHQLNITFPQPTKKPIYVPSNDDINSILNVVRGKEMEKAIYLAAFGSLRRGEVAALTYYDILKDSIIVNKAMVETANGWIIKHPKTLESDRVVMMPEFVIKRLMADAPKNGDYSQRVVKLNPHTITNNFHRITEKANVTNFRFHDLRHYQASILHANGVPDKYIMARGGWSTDDTLKRIYQHIMPKKNEDVNNEICDYFANNFGNDDNDT